MKSVRKPRIQSLRTLILGLEIGETVKVDGYSPKAVQTDCSRLRTEGLDISTTTRKGTVYITRLL